MELLEIVEHDIGSVNIGFDTTDTSEQQGNANNNKNATSTEQTSAIPISQRKVLCFVSSERF